MKTNQPTNRSPLGRFVFKPIYYVMALLMSTSSFAQLKVESSGNVGIGISSPIRTFHVNSTKLDGTIALFQSINSRLFISKNPNSTAINIDVYNLDGNRSELNLQPYGGNVGIGTLSPSAKLEVNGNFLFSSEYYKLYFPYANGVSGGITGDDFNYKRLTLFHGHGIAFETGTNEPNFGYTKMIIGSNGNVGIGTNNPNERLHVNGNVKIEG